MEEGTARAKVGRIRRIRRQRLKKTLLKKKEEFEGKLEEAEKRFMQVVLAQTDQVATASHIGDCTNNGDERVLGKRIGFFRKCIIECDEALETIEKGTYGTCQECEEEIPIARLEKMPSAVLCVLCQTEKDRRNVLTK